MDAKKPLIFGASALMILMLAANTSADELPKELLLHCQGSAEVHITRANKTERQKDRFDLTLRLRDGSIANTEYNFLEGKNCALLGEVIRCEFSATAYNSELDTTSQEHRAVTISRDTGEMHLSLETKTFDGTSTSGEPTATITSSRTGVCHSAATQPLF
ncbi:MAG: hypothetical protein WBD53_03685 [Xanthobacteraceae bacterium]